MLRRGELGGAAACIAALLCAALVAGCTGNDHTPILDCEAGHGITPDCRFHNPEDMVVSPSGRHIIVSQMGSLEHSTPGSLVAFTPETGEIRALFPKDGVPPPAPHAATWGDDRCAPVDEDLFSPHGIDIERRKDGRNELFVINHGGRESVEFFEVIEVGEVLAIEWRGCAKAPKDGFFNDVVGLTGGGFWASQMYPRSANQTLAMLRVLLTGYSPGFAYAWDRNEGFTPIAGSVVKFANGVEKSADERHLFMSAYFGDEVVKVDVAAGERVASAAVSSVDNLSWSPTGELLAASHTASLTDTTNCLDLETGSCGFGFELVAIDPETMTPRTLFAHEGAPMGAATVALPFADSVYLGTFAGDRISRIDAAVLARK